MSCLDGKGGGSKEKKTTQKHNHPTVHSFYRSVRNNKQRRNKPNPSNNDTSSVVELNSTLDRLADVISNFNAPKKIVHEISTQTAIEDAQVIGHVQENKVSEYFEGNNLYIKRLLTKILQFGLTCRCGIETKIKGSMATRLYCCNNYPEYSNGYLSFVNNMGNARSDIDINTCAQVFHRIMSFFSTISTDMKLMNKSSFMGDSDMMRRNAIKYIYTYEFNLNPNNDINTYMGLMKEINITIDFCIVKANAPFPFLTHSHRIFWCGFNSYGILPINYMDVKKYTIRGLIEYCKMIIHENKMSKTEITIKEFHEIPTNIKRDINIGCYNLIRDKLFREKISYKLVNFSNQYKNLSIKTSNLNSDEYMNQLYIKWVRKTRAWGIRDKISCPKEKEAWISFIRDQLNEDDIYSSEPLTETKRIVLRPCGHISDYVGYLSELVLYLIYRMNRLEGQPPSYEEGGVSLQSHNKCPYCRYESFQIGTIREEFRCNSKIFGRDISLSNVRRDFIHPIS